MATPYYLIQDPKSGRVLSRPTGVIATVDAFRGFLQAGLDAKEQVGRR